MRSNLSSDWPRTTHSQKSTGALRRSATPCGNACRGRRRARRCVAALPHWRGRPFAINWRAGWAAMAASTAAAFAAGSIAAFVALGPPGREPIPELLVASHMRALMASQTVDVASSDRHTVKPWFNGKLPQSPRVVDLAAQGFPLVGGRIDVIGLTPVPTLVYRARLHVISLT